MIINSDVTLSDSIDQIDRAWRMEFDSPLDVRPLIKILVHRLRQCVLASDYSQVVDNPYKYKMDVKESTDSAFLANQATVDKVLASSRALIFNGDGTLTLTMEHVLELLRSIMDSLGEAKYRELKNIPAIWQYWPGTDEPNISSGEGGGHELTTHHSRDNVTWNAFGADGGVVVGWHGGNYNHGEVNVSTYEGLTGAPAEAFAAVGRALHADSSSYIQIPAERSNQWIQFRWYDDRLRMNGNISTSSITQPTEITDWVTVICVHDRVYVLGDYVASLSNSLQWYREESSRFKLYGNSKVGDSEETGYGLHVGRIEWYLLDAVPSEAEADELASFLHSDLMASVSTL
jgi:hypothetical protein